MNARSVYFYQLGCGCNIGLGVWYIIGGGA